jgi:hypothetical protein
MTGAPAVLADLLAECEAHGIRLMLAGDGLEIDAPQDALTPDLLGLLKAHKVDLLATLRPASEAATEDVECDAHRPLKKLKQSKPVCRCGSTTWRDVVLKHPPHNGTTIRRDCGRCGRFIDFPVWYGNAGHKDQYPV